MYINLLNFNRIQMEKFFTDIGEAPFHGRQIFQWIHQHGVTDFDSMSNLGKSLRLKLQQMVYIRFPTVIREQHSSDGTVKWLMGLCDNNSIETVYIPEEDRGTLCVSSQVGCALNCRFCSTAQQGFNRNLSVAEIIGQVWVAVRKLSKNRGKHDRHITNVVMMGMGEPLLNMKNVISAMDIMMDDLAYGLSKYRVTLSTSGVVPGIYELSRVSPVSLAVSLHAPFDELRTQLVPINKKYPLKMLMEACKDFFKTETRRQITMEYVMLKGINDKPKHACQLIKILQGVRAKVNLIPFNPFPGTLYACSTVEDIIQFRSILTKAGINTIIRKTRGADIDAACGQLVGNFMDKTKHRLWKDIPIEIETAA